MGGIMASVRPGVEGEPDLDLNCLASYNAGVIREMRGVVLEEE
jgi:hypothetical protein